MTEKEHRSFFGMPSLGGKLTLVNANFWIVAFLLMRGGAFSQDTPEYLFGLFGILMTFLSLPFCTFLILPTVGTPRAPGVAEIVASAALFGFNAFVWGYGLAWCYERVRSYFGNGPPRGDANK